MGSPTGVDVLEWPVVGRLLRWRHARTSLQLVLLAAAAVVVLHGLFGPDIAPGNLATVLTWVHYRGLLVVALLAAGNFFCAGCPFVLVRDWGRRLHAPSRLWPQAASRQVDRHRALRRGAVRLRALRSVGAAAGHGVSGPRVLRRRAGDRHGLQRRDVLQAPVPDRAVQLRGVHDLAARTEDSRTGDLPGVPDVGLHRRAPVARGAAENRPAGLRAAPLSAGQGRQHRLHVLPGLRARLPVRQHRALPCGRRASSSPTRGGDRGLAASSTVRTSRSSRCSSCSGRC